MESLISQKRKKSLTLEALFIEEIKPELNNTNTKDVYRVQKQDIQIKILVDIVIMVVYSIVYYFMFCFFDRPVIVINYALELSNLYSTVYKLFPLGLTFINVSLHF